MKNNIVITAVGDIQLSRDIQKYITKCKKEDYSNIFKYVKKYIEKSDISIANLESPISNRENLKKIFMKGSPNFLAKEKVIDALNNSGLNTLTIANNHSNDYGNIAIKDTIKILNDNKFNVLSIKEKPYKLFNINGYKIIIVGMTRKFNKLNENPVDVYIYNEDTPKLLKYLKKKCDLLIVTIHWGGEYKFTNNKNQKKMATEMIENGVDIIIGHHPHVIQNMEKININDRYGYVFYSLGNFIFDSHYKKKGVRDTMILKIIIDKHTKRYNFEYLPCIIYPQLGFIPKPKTQNFIKKYPSSYTKKGNDLYDNVFKYLDCKNIISGGKYSINLKNIILFTIVISLSFYILQYKLKILMLKV